MLHSAAALDVFASSSITPSMSDETKTRQKSRNPLVFSDSKSDLRPFVEREAPPNLDQKAEKPSINEIIAYAKPNLKKLLAKHALNLPLEQREEIEQDAYVRLLEVYDSIDPEKGWKSFVYTHCFGTIKDYMKAGKGFSEDKWTLSNAESEDNENEADKTESETKSEEPKTIEVKAETKVPKMRERVFMTSSENEDYDIDFVLGRCGIFNQSDFERLNIQWDLIAQLASLSDSLHVFAKWLRGFTLDEMSGIFSLSKSRIAQMLQEFVNDLDMIDSIEEQTPLTRQIVYALGLARIYGMKDRDQSEVFGIVIGQDLKPVDLDSFEPFSAVDHNQRSLFG